MTILVNALTAARPPPAIRSVTLRAGKPIGAPKPGEQPTRDQLKELLLRVLDGMIEGASIGRETRMSQLKCAVCGEHEDYFCMLCGKAYCSRHKCEHTLRSEFSDQLQKEREKHKAFQQGIYYLLAFVIIFALFCWMWWSCAGRATDPNEVGAKFEISEKPVCALASF